jgi:hypothetical protein
MVGVPFSPLPSESPGHPSPRTILLAGSGDELRIEVTRVLSRTRRSGFRSADRAE